MTTRTPTPLPVDGSGGVLLFGGTFDPVHLGHVQLARNARDACDPGIPIVFVPAARSPHKDAGPVASDADRVRMLALAIAELEGSGVWSEELDRAGESGEPSYWIDTLIAARAQAGEQAVLRFLIGADQLLALPHWHRWRELLELAAPVVLARQPYDDAAAILDAMRSDPAWAGFDPDTWASRIVRAPVLPYAATSIRAALARGDAVVPGLDPRVLGYIKERSLYS